MKLEIIIAFLGGVLTGVVITTAYLLMDIIKTKTLPEKDAKKIKEILGEE